MAISHRKKPIKPPHAKEIQAISTEIKIAITSQMEIGNNNPNQAVEYFHQGVSSTRISIVIPNITSTSN
jgi:hypothetical protein